MRFEVLGPLTVRAQDGTAVPAPEPKVRALLAALLVRAGRPVPVDTLVDDLWGDRMVPSSPANSLQTKVSQLRRALDTAEPGGRALVVYGPAGYELRVPPEDVDAARFASLTSRAYETDADDVRTKVSLLTDALALWRGRAYADFRDAAFVREAVSRLEEQRLTAQETLSELRLELGEHVALADELAFLVARDPLRERLRAVHLRALYRSGRPAEALDSYRDLRLRLADELGIDPGPELAALHEAMLRQDPGLAAPTTAHAAPPSAAAERPLTNLPAPTTGLVGREPAVARVRDLVRTARLVTLTGPGGVGKTRLALESATGLTADFPDGIWLAELAGTRGEVVSTVAAALGIRDDGVALGVRDGGAAGVESARAAVPGVRDDAVVPDVPGVPGVRDDAVVPGVRDDAAAEQWLGRALAGRRLLLVLDNCEHLLGPVADMATALLRHAPHVRILATSQEPLALSGETLEAVAPLGEEEALRLFATRAAAAAPGFTLDDGNREAAALICRRLDGIPLAVELAATRVRALGVHALADRLHDRFRLLNQARRDAPARQRTLRAMIDWSWELLTPPERRALRQLAVFQGGFTLAGAEEVIPTPAQTAPEQTAPEQTAPEQTDLEDGNEGEGEGEGDTLDLITRLVDRSLLAPVTDARDPRDHHAEPPEIRYRMLESVTAYSLERLDEAAETLTLRRRHAHYFATFAERAATALRGPDQRSWLRRLDRETVNLRTALEWSVTDADATTALRLVNAQTWYWFLRGRLREAMRSLDTALNLPLPTRSTTAESPATGAEGAALDTVEGRPVEGRAAEGRPVAAAAAEGRATGGAAAAGGAVAGAAVDAPDLPPRGTDPGEPPADDAALQSARTAAASAHAAFALLTGEDARAHGRTCERGPTTPADARSRWLLAFARCGFDHTPDETARVDALLAEFRAAGDRWGEAATLSTRATRALYRGDLPALRRDATRSAALFAELGDRWGQLQSSEQLGVLAEIAADYDTAARLQRDGMRGAEELELWTDVSFRLSRLGRLALLTGDDPAATDFHTRAARLAAQQTHRPAQQFAETGLAIGARHRGDLDTAEELLLPWLDFNRRFGVDSGTALILAHLGYVAEQRGDPGRAEHLHREGLAVARTTGDERAVALALEGLAGARSLAGDHAYAAGLLGTAARIREATGAPLPPAERTDTDRASRRCRSALSDAAFETAYEKGADA
ncbi:AfsR/SARP family transcriptional regulator [Streptomyces sp. NPDC003032]